MRGHVGSKYIPDAHAACDNGGCQFNMAQKIAQQAVEAVSMMGRNNMSQALWCDNGGHAFSERDPGRQRISVATIDPDTEREIMESRDFCGECADKAGITRPRKTRPAILGGRKD